MLQTRRAIVDDASLIAAHRKAMFMTMGGRDEGVLEIMRRRSEPWLERMIAAGKYIGWITFYGKAPVASAGLLLLDWPPHPLDPESELRGYILNVFVESAWRRQGLAKRLLEVCLEEAHKKGIRAIALHASDEGRPLYEALGFQSTNEMIFRRPDPEPK